MENTSEAINLQKGAICYIRILGRPFACIRVEAENQHHWLIQGKRKSCVGYAAKDGYVNVKPLIGSKTSAFYGLVLREEGEGRNQHLVVLRQPGGEIPAAAR